MDIPNKHIILFDGICNLCNSSVNFILTNDKNELFYFTSLQSDLGQKILIKHQLDPNNFDTFLYYNPITKNISKKSTAAIQVFSNLKSPYKFASILIYIPKSFRDYIYMIISKNRYKWFGKSEHCSLEHRNKTYRFLDNI